MVYTGTSHRGDGNPDILAMLVSAIDIIKYNKRNASQSGIQVQDATPAEAPFFRSWCFVVVNYAKPTR